MKSPVRILHLEDSPRDAAMIRDRLRADGLVCEIVWVEDKEHFEEALAGEAFDLVLCDYNLPGYDGITATRLARERHPDTPVIMISGSLSPDDAVECLKQGATDYLLKQRLERLAPALKRAIEEAAEHRERQRVETALRESEKKFTTIFHNSPVAIGLTTPKEGRIMEVNESYCQLLGYSREELIGRTTTEMNLYVDQEERRRLMAVLQREGRLRQLETRYRHRSGEVRHVLISSELIEVAGEQVILGISSDITERKRAEQVLAESEQRFRNLFESSRAAIFVEDFDGHVLDVNPAACRLHGLSREQLLSKSARDLVPEEQHAIFDRDFPRLVSGELTQVEGFSLRADGTAVPVELSASHVLYGGQPLLVLHVRDITVRKEAERALWHNEQRLRSLIENSEEAISLFDADGRILFFPSPATTRILGYSDVDLVGKSVFELFHPEDLPRAIEVFGQIVNSPGQLLGGQFRVRHKDGTWRWIESSGRNLLDEPSMQAIVVNFRDITARNAAEAERARLWSVIEASLNEIYVFDSGTFRFEYENPAALRNLGYSAEAMRAMTPLDLKPEFNAASFAEMIQPLRSHEQENLVFRTEHRRADGSHYPVEVHLQLVEQDGNSVFLAVINDITERERTQRQMLRTQRLESIGTLAGGVAHDLNNALAPILMSVELLRMQYPEETEMIDTIETSARHGADMVRQLLTFSKGVEGARLLIQPEHLLKEMEKIMKSAFPKNIDLRTRIARDLWTLVGDSTQLHQVLLNLCVNARDAMPGGGTLTLEAENVEMDATYASGVPEARPGRYVVWRVTDTGTGIAPEILDRIFEPFFSTKGPDKGTGLGLSTVLGIVQSHGGFVQVHSTLGQGTTIAVHLPAADADISAIAVQVKARTKFRGHGETILVVDDEPAVRQVTRTVLTALNFQVITACDGAEALSLVAEKRNELRAVITDLHMPNLDGLAFVRVLKHVLQEPGIIVASGRLEERELEEFKALGVSAVLNKPFTQEDLVEALKKVFQK